jgi:hypothetical protein
MMKVDIGPLTEKHYGMNIVFGNYIDLDALL